MASEGVVDLHSHLVPGVDDGAESVAAALHALEVMHAEGVAVAVTTPHLAAHVTHDPERLDAVLGEMDAALGALREGMADHAGPLPEVARGHEVALDDPEPVFDDPRLRLAETDFVLVEWAYMKPPAGAATLDLLARLRAQGWIPVLAHPERYRGVGEDLSLVQAWLRAGALLQVNHGSLLGVYGRAVQSNAQRILARGLAHVLSSDYHGWDGRAPGVAGVREWFAAREREETFDLLTRENPGRLLNGELPRTVPPLETSTQPGFLSRIRERFRSG
jgi:protein-tyrosine phosphatase